MRSITGNICPLPMALYFFAWHSFIKIYFWAVVSKIMLCMGIGWPVVGKFLCSG